MDWRGHVVRRERSINDESRLSQDLVTPQVAGTAARDVTIADKGALQF